MEQKNVKVVSIDTDNMLYMCDDGNEYPLMDGLESLSVEELQEHINKDLNVRVVKVGKEIDKIVLTNYLINEKTKTIYNGKLNKEVPKKYYGEITHKSDWEKHIEQMLSDDWEGNEEIFVPEDECSKPFNTPKILGCVDNINDIIE